MGNIKYTYQGIPFKEWCLNNNKSYSTAVRFLLKNKDNYPNQLDLIDACIKFLNEEKTIYKYNNISLKQYCLSNNLSYTTALTFINKNINYYENIDDCIKECIRYLENKDHKIKYYYKGMTLRDYCENNNISYSTVKAKINELKKDNFKIEEDIINQIVEHYKNQTKTKEYYKIEGISLRKYCLNNNINYSTIKSYIKEFKTTCNSFNNEELALLAIKKYKNTTKKNYCYYYKNIPLRKYCQANDLDYELILRMLRKQKQLDTYNITDEQMNNCIHRNNISKNKKIYNKITTCNDQKEIINYSKEVNISIKEITTIMEQGYDIKQAFIYYWFTNKSEIEPANDNMKLNELIGLYKSNIENTIDIIYKKCKKPIFKIANEILNEYPYCFKNAEKIIILENLTKYYFLECISSVTGKNEAAIVTYMNKYIKGNLLKYILNELENTRFDRLDKVLVKDKNKEITLKDRIIIKTIESRFYENLDYYAKLNNVEKIILTFRFEHLYTFEYISKLLDLSYIEVINIYNESINKIRDNLNIKVLTK